MTKFNISLGKEDEFKVEQFIGSTGLSFDIFIDQYLLNDLQTSLTEFINTEYLSKILRESGLDVGLEYLNRNTSENKGIVFIKVPQKHVETLSQNSAALNKIKEVVYDNGYTALFVPDNFSIEVYDAKKDEIPSIKLAESTDTNPNNSGFEVHMIGLVEFELYYKDEIAVPSLMVRDIGYIMGILDLWKNSTTKINKITYPAPFNLKDYIKLKELLSTFSDLEDVILIECSAFKTELSPDEYYDPHFDPGNEEPDKKPVPFDDSIGYYRTIFESLGFESINFFCRLQFSDAMIYKNGIGNLILSHLKHDDKNSNE